MNEESNYRSEWTPRKIDDGAVKNAALPPSGNRIIFDADHKNAIKGFGVRVTAGGARSFVLNYRNADGTARRYTIGAYGRDQWSVEAARKEAGNLKKRIDRGEDPQGEKRATREADTVADLCERYCEDWLPRKRESSQLSDRRIIKSLIGPKLGKRKVKSIGYAEIDGLHRSLKATPYQANRTLALLSKMFTLAIRWGLRPDNPCRGIERYPEVKRRRYLKGDETARLIKALAELDDQTAANAIRLCLLTGCRRGEALKATWSQFDLETGHWTKPGATTKQKTEHQVPLSAAVATLVKDMLAQAPRDDAGELASAFVFPGTTPDMPLADVRDAWDKLRTAAGIPDVRLHDLRHTFASILASAGQSLPLIGALLGHTQPATTQRYAHLFDDPLRQAVDTVGAVVTGTKGAEVVPFTRGGAA